jgi:hypothetical protein
VCGSGLVDGGASAQLCVATCAPGAGCPHGFTCDTTTSPPRCTADHGFCCLDNDGDQFGVGQSCLGPDCNDHDSAIYPGHVEICDGKDNNCNGLVDEGYLCPAESCAEVMSTGTYAATPLSMCVKGQCSTPLAAPCGPYTCQPVPSPIPGTICRTACMGADDASCIDSAFCDGAACVTRLPSGSACTRDHMCASNHCQNGFCCAAGDCCSVGADCPSHYTNPPSCDTPLQSCQGHRVDAVCGTDKTCNSGVVADDTACTSAININCGSFPTQSCNGTAMQTPLACPTSCSNDTQCAPTAYCVVSSGICVGRVPDGDHCTADDQCAQGHFCHNNFCCSSATQSCCNVATDCPAAYAAAPVCDAPVTSCAGHRMDKTCTANVCGSTRVTDDSGCTSADQLGCYPYVPQTCNGQASQGTLACVNYCFADSDCVQPTNHCYYWNPYFGDCEAWHETGTACDNPRQCRSGYCVANICCSTPCNSTTCDTCGGGNCNPFQDSYEGADYCPGIQINNNPNQTLTAYISNGSDIDDWFFFWADDNHFDFCQGSIDLSFTPPAGVSLSVRLWKWHTSCGDLELMQQGSSSFNWGENCGFSSDSAWYLVQIHGTGGYSCTSPYSINIHAHI